MRCSKFLNVFLFLLACSSLQAANETTCLDPSMVAVSDLVPGMDSRLIYQAGRPVSVEAGDGVDDSGTYISYIYHYDNYDIDVVHDSIDVIHITSPEFIWAGKIQIGSDRDLVMQQLDIKPVVNEETSSQHVICSDAGDVYAILHFLDDKVTDIQLVLDRP